MCIRDRNVGVASMTAMAGIILDPVNPLGWLAGLAIPVFSAIAWFAMPHKKRVLNDNPLAIYGKRWGMVRARDENGKMTWFPAFSGSKEEWTTAFSANSTIRLSYGRLEDLVFKAERDGTIKPYFLGIKHQKEFNITTRDWNDTHRGLTKLHGTDWTYAGKKYQEKYDPLRNWFLYSAKDKNQMLEYFVKGDVQKIKTYKEHYDTRENMGAYTKNLLDLNDALAFVDKWKRNYGHDDITVDAYGQPGLRRVANESSMFNPKMDWKTDYKYPFRHVRDNLQNAKDTAELITQMAKEKHNLPTGKWLLKYLGRQSRDLLRTQEFAAKKAGYQKLSKENGLSKYWYRFYNPDAGYAPALSATELEKQLSLIHISEPTRPY